MEDEIRNRKSSQLSGRSSKRVRLMHKANVDGGSRSVSLATLYIR